MKILLLAVALGVVGSLSGQPFLPSSHPRTSKSTDTITAHVIANIWWGIGCASDFERACDVAAQWADRDPIAAFIYAECLTDRRRCPCQYRRADSLRTAAIDALRRRADSGDSYALVALAECYRRSLGGMAPSEDSASALIARAAALGNPLAAFMLATETSDSSVQRLLSRAVEGQVVAAMVARARRLLADTMTTTEAIALLCRADSLGSPDAALLLGGCYDSGFGVERNPTLALQHIAVAADRGSIPAMLELGIRSLWGAGIPADTIGGLNWLLTALARSIPATRSAIVALLVGVRDSLPAVMRWIDRAVHRFAIRYDHQRLDSEQVMCLLTGDGVRAWKAWWRPSLVAPLQIVMRDDGSAFHLGVGGLVEARWRYDATRAFTIEPADEHSRFNVIAIADGLCAIEWNGSIALYTPMSSAELRSDSALRWHQCLRPTLELLPPRIGDDYIRIRVRARNVPRSGVVIVPIGLAKDRRARYAELSVGARTLWRIWEDGLHELIWRPLSDDVPHLLPGKYSLFLQCTWQYDGEDESMVVKSQPWALPTRWQRR